ncbi:MAG: hypothetical protein A4E72_01712 [Syntrophus sp. PtaU1.Bin208]|nr:MAG: hypothetical protein A4E72_01712 [Syntrophus sp. PtaU1.Bin208]
MVDAEFLRLEGLEKFHGNGLDPFDLLSREVRLLEEVKDRQGFLVETFPHGPAFLLAHPVHKPQQVRKGLFDGHAVLLAVVLVNDFLVAPLKVRPQRVLPEQAQQALFDGRLEILHRGAPGRAPFKLPPQPVEVDPADVERGLLFRDVLRLGLNGLINHRMQLADDVADVRLLPVLLKAFVDDLNCLVILPVGVDAFHGNAGLELGKNRPAEDFEAFPRLVVLVGRLLGRQNGRVPLKSRLCDNVVQRSLPFGQKGPHQRDGFGQVRQQFLLRFGGFQLAPFAASASIARSGKGRQGLAEILEDAAVIHDHPVVLALVDAVRPGDGLHQGVRLEGLVQVERGQARDVEAREPHRADNGNPEGVLLFLEGVIEGQPLQIVELRQPPHGFGQVHALLHQAAMGKDVQVPLAELLHLALLLADHYRHTGLAHPLDLPEPDLFVLLIGRLRQRPLQFADPLIPVKFDQSEHPHAGDLVDAHDHGLARFPGRGVVLHEIRGDLIEAPARREDVVIAIQLLFEPLLHIDVFRLQFLQLPGDPVVEIPDCHAELVAPGVVVQRHRGLVLDGPLEVVGRDVFPENPPGDFVVLEERRPGKADVACARQGVAHIQRQGAVLGAVRLVGDDDEVVALGVRLFGLDLTVELLDQRKDVGLVLCQQSAEVLAAGGPAGIAVVVHDAAAGEGLVDLRVQVLAVGQHQEGEIPAQPAVDLPREHHHRVALPRPLGMPENPQLSVALPAAPDGLDGPVDAQELVIPGQDLLRPPRRVVEEDEILQQVQKVLPAADPLEQRLHVHRARQVLGQALPLVEKLVGAAQRADLRVDAVAQDDGRVEVKEVSHGVQVVLVIVFVGDAEVPVDVLQFHEKQRQAVDKPHDVGPPAVKVAPHPELPHAEKRIVLRLAEVEGP